MATTKVQEASKVVWFFNGSGFGWSETWEYLGNADHATVAIAAKKYAGLRLNTLSSDTSLKGIRITNRQTGTRGRYVDIRPQKSDPPEFRLTGKATTEGRDYRNTAVLVKCVGQNDHIRNFPMASVPDLIGGGISEIIDSGKAPNWTVDAVVLQKYMISGVWGFRARKDPIAPYDRQTVVEMVYATAPPLNVVVGVPDGGSAVAKGDLVQVRNAQKIDTRAAGMNGIWKVIDVVGPLNGIKSYELAGTTGRLSNQGAKLGTLEKVGYEYHSLQDFDFLKTMTRKRGVGGIRPVGRRRVRDRAISALVTTS